MYCINFIGNASVPDALKALLVRLGEISRDYNAKLKNNSELYFEDDSVPRTIISVYHNNGDLIINKSPEVLHMFKKLYITNEDFVDGHSPEEKMGLAAMYDYFQEFNINNLNLYTILKLHQLLFSKCPFPEFGGGLRVENRYLPNSGVEIPNHDLVPQLIFDLLPKFNELLDLSATDSFNVFAYIDKAIALYCDLLKIHPFPDGNGRTMRAFLNLLFMRVKLPPVYIDFDERNVYGRTLNKAFVKGDFEPLNKFYYFKIYSSIMELGLISSFGSGLQNDAVEVDEDGVRLYRG